jgi:hypothetical protein
MNFVYLLTIIRPENDYKRRYGDRYLIKVYGSEFAAQEALKKELIEHIEEDMYDESFVKKIRDGYFSDLEDESDKEDEKENDKEKSNWEEDKEDEDDENTELNLNELTLSDIEEITNKWCNKADYVPCRIKWSITKEIIN